MVTFDIMKVPILKYIYFVYVESEKMPEELVRSKEYVKQLIVFEFKRL